VSQNSLHAFWLTPAKTNTTFNVCQKNVQMKTISAVVLFSIFSVLLSCTKSTLLDDQSVLATNSTSLDHKKILLDASRDGRVWWSPQSPLTGFTSSGPHQGKALADYLRSRGYTVDELRPGTVITNTLLQSYSRVIRANAFYNYTSAEVAAYDEFLKRHCSLLLINDHMQNTSNDLLSQQLGVEFAGVAFGTISVINPHAITSGVTTVPFNAGCAIVNRDKSNMVILGRLGASEYVDLNNNGQYDSGDIKSPAVMGILAHATSKIFFLSDLNGIEQVPQPFTNNLVNWLF
jgi:hypothetical protein